MKNNYIQLMILLIVSLSVRVILLNLYPYLWISHADSIDYFLQSIDLSILPQFNQSGIDHNAWYLKTPAYLIYLKLTFQNLYIQILFSVIAVYLLFKMNKIAGWLYALYPPFWYYDVMYFKEGILLDLIVIVIYFLRNKNWIYKTIAICLIMIPFQSFGIVADSTASRRIPFLNNWFALWYPSFNVPAAHWPEWNYILTPIYIFMIFNFLKAVKWKSFEWLIWIVFSLSFGVIYGNARYREVFMIILFLWIGEKIKEVRND